MRTTVTLETDVAEKLRKLAHQHRQPFKKTLDEVLRRGLASQERASRQTPFVVQPHCGGFRPGIDEAKLNQLVDQLDADDFVNEASGK